MAYNLTDGVTQGMIDAELGDDDGGCEGCPECMEPMEEAPMMNLSHCFSCPREADSADLFFCTETPLCIEHLGPMCRECRDAHTITHHQHQGEEAA